MLTVSQSVSPVHQVFFVSFGRLILSPPPKKGVNGSHRVGPRLQIKRREKCLLSHARVEEVKYGANLNTQKRRATKYPQAYSSSIHFSQALSVYNHASAVVQMCKEPLMLQETECVADSIWMPTRREKSIPAAKRPSFPPSQSPH